MEIDLLKVKILPILVSKQACISFFGGQRFESKKFVHICVQTNMITFFLIDQVFERPVIPLGGFCLPSSYSRNK